MVETISLTDKATQFEQTRRNGVEFLLSNISSSGEIADAYRSRFGYYRVPWALAVSGETAAAAAVLDWVERACIGDDGRIHGGVPWDPAANRMTNTYAETIIAYGAHLLRRFDIARRTMRFARTFHDPVSGGVYMTREETGPRGRQLLFPTCQFGMSATITGDLESALAVGRWLENLWNAQPELPDRLYTIWTPAGGLATSVPPGEAAIHYVNESQETHQLHYNGGIAAACLTHLFMATGDQRWLDLAREFQRFSMESTEGQFQTKQVCKSAWGSGLISLAARDDSHLTWLIKMGDWFASGQEPDGRWSNTARLDPNPPLAHQIEITAEFVVHMDTLIAALAAISARQAKGASS
jgi:hypothetical protein